MGVTCGEHLVFVLEGEYISVGKTPSVLVYFWYSFCCYCVFLTPLFFAFRKWLSQPMASALVLLLLEALEVRGADYLVLISCWC